MFYVTLGGGRADRRPGRRRHPRPADRRRGHRRRRRWSLSQGIFGAVSCAQDLPKCVAAAGADGLIKTLALIPDGRRVDAGSGHDRPVVARTAVHPGRHLRRPGAAVLPDLAAGRGADHRPAQIWPAFFGLIGWGAAMGLGGAFLTMLIAARGRGDDRG